MQTILRKLTSRKLWMALAGVVTGIAMVFGVEENAIATVAGAVTAISSVVSYVLAEGKIDAAFAAASSTGAAVSTEESAPATETPTNSAEVAV